MSTTPYSLLQRLRLPAEQLAWERFVDLYGPLLHFWACRLGLNEQDAADLIWEVFAVLVERLPHFTYDPHKSFRSWLHTVLLNKWRELRRRKTLPLEQGVDLSQVPEADTTLLFEEAEYRQCLVGRALELMQAEFQPTTWTACWEHVVSGKPAAEVARELGITVGAVRVAKCRVLQRLRQELDGLLD